MKSLKRYDREAAVRYAHKWALSTNPAYYNYDKLGGDCTNFASQCIYAGSGVMNYTPTFGWYYIDANRKAPAWTGVPYLYNFLTRKSDSVGPKARECTMSELQPGDIIQLLFDGSEFQHCPVVVDASAPFSPSDILVAAHSYNADYRPLITYDYREIRCLHIEGVVQF